MADLTTDDLARLRVPLSALPRLDFLGLPLVPVEGARGYAVGEMLGFGRVVIARYGAADAVAVSSLSLDLSDSSTADRVARWLAGRLGVEVWCTAPSWVCVVESVGWWIFSGEPRSLHRPAPLAGKYFPRGVYAEQADPTDGRRLDDGSRYVDRLALRLVAEEVGRG
ncbi:MAG: hypothetical protein ABL912_01740 [Novosphingobium sp.]